MAHKNKENFETDDALSASTTNEQLVGRILIMKIHF